MTTSQRFRVRAPQLRGRGWLNTGGRELTLADLRGRVVLLDFWTFCCINCLHVLDELRPVEEEFGDALVVVGVHSPKFEHERDAAALAAAVERYEVRHPVLDDPDLETWQQYAARAWPTLAVVDPEGYLVASMAGEGHAEGLRRLVRELVDEHTAKGTLTASGTVGAAPEAPATALRFPGKIAVLPGGTLLVSDSAHHSLVELAADGETVLRRIGAGVRGHVDGGPEVARFSEPQGVCVLPTDVAGQVGYDVLVADTVNHRLRGVRLTDGTVTTVAGSGEVWRGAPGDPVEVPADPLAARLSSPWDVAWYEDRVVVAMAGIHQLWSFDPVTGTLAVFAGTTVESLRDGPVGQAWFAQPSGLAVDRTRLWIADSESSALRWIARDSAGIQRVHTAVGQGLFDFGAMDGAGDQALFQHPLGVAVLPDGAVAVCDTYNNAIRRYDPETRTVSTLATDVAEPSGAVVLDGELVVVESAAHRIVRPIAPGRLAQVSGSRHRTRRPLLEVGPGAVTLEVTFEPAPGQKLDDRFGPSTRLEVSASPAGLLRSGAGSGTELTRALELAEPTDEAEPSESGDGILQVVAQGASCDIDGPNPACHLNRQDWGVPIRVVPDGPTTITLVLRG